MLRLIYAIISCRRHQLLIHGCLLLLWPYRIDDNSRTCNHWVLTTESLGRTTPIQRTRWPCENVVSIVNLALNPEAFPLKITISLFSAQNNFARRWPFFIYIEFIEWNCSHFFAGPQLQSSCVQLDFSHGGLQLPMASRFFFVHQMRCLQYSLIWKRRNWVFLLSLNVYVKQSVNEWAQKKVWRVFQIQWQTEI